MRRAAFAVLLLVSGCGLTPNPLATTSSESLTTASLPTREPTIDEIERRLKKLEAKWFKAKDRRAVFCTAYRVSTRNIRTNIAGNEFKDPDKVTKAVVRFGVLYFAAQEAYDAGQFEKVPPAWRIANDSAAKGKVGTTLVLSMNAHIIRDLPFATATLDTSDPAWQSDYKKLNGVLSAEVQEIRKEIVALYGSWDGPSRQVERWDDVLAGHAVTAARAVSWKHAVAIDRDPKRGGAENEAYATRMAETLDHDKILAILWEWLKRTTQAS